MHYLVEAASVMADKASGKRGNWAAVDWEAEEHTTREVVHAVDPLVMPIKRECRGRLRQRPYLQKRTVRHQCC